MLEAATARRGVWLSVYAMNGQPHVLAKRAACWYGGQVVQLATARQVLPIAQFTSGVFETFREADARHPQ